MGFGPLGPNQPTWLGWTKPARVWVGQTDPAQPPHSPPLFFAVLWRILITTAVARPVRPAPVTSATDAWGKIVASTPSTPSSNWIRWEFPLRGDLWLVSPRFPPSPVASSSMPHRALSWCLLRDLWWLWCVCARRWCGVPSGAVVKTTSGSLWPAAWALPCHDVQTSTRALVSVSSFSLPLSFFSGHGLWPSGQDQWAKLTDWYCEAA
jgi:hypothetical protein